MEAFWAELIGVVLAGIIGPPIIAVLLRWIEKARNEEWVRLPWVVSALTAVSTATIVSAIFFVISIGHGAEPAPSGPQALPSGAVLAFANERGCPAGWELFKPATARAIIGAGATFQPEYAKDDRGENLTPKGYLEAKGEQKHLLSKGELPKEPVFFAAFFSTEFALVNNGGFGGDRFVGAKPEGGPPLGRGAAGTFERRVTEPMGENMPHNITSPYLALYYCQKG